MSEIQWPCCEHCEPEPNGKCWASEVGHGCSCLKCPPTRATTPPAETDHEPEEGQ